MLQFRSAFFTATYVVVLGSLPPDAGAQITPRLDLGGSMEVGGEAERYLRALQLSGVVPISGWTSLPFSPAVERAMVANRPHPWQARMGRVSDTAGFRWLRPYARTVLNSDYPVQHAVGPAWAGRGISALMQAGMSGRAGPFEFQLAPLVFASQNASFQLARNGLGGAARLADARFPGEIDAPQRFGEGTYARADAGASFVRLGLPWVTAGVSSAPQRIGPARDYPLVLGPAAGGFLHGFVGTNKPADLKWFTVQARLVAGPLPQSDYALTTTDVDRFASAGVVSITPAGANGLELGFMRFFNAVGGATVSRALKPFRLVGFIGAQGDTVVDNVPGENQVASAFFRWAHPPAGFEIYGEFYREDYAGDLRKFILKPDDLGTFAFGVQRVLTATATHHRVFRFELVNGELSHQERGQRGGLIPLPPYLHFSVRQGHTLRGRILGSEEAYGGSGWKVGVDEFTVRGRRSFGVERRLRLDWLPELAGVTNGPQVHPDVEYGVRWEERRFAGKRDYGISLAPSLNLNRNLISGRHRFNLHAAVDVRGWP